VIGRSALRRDGLTDRDTTNSNRLPELARSFLDGAMDDASIQQFCQILQADGMAVSALVQMAVFDETLTLQYEKHWTLTKKMEGNVIFDPPKTGGDPSFARNYRHLSPLPYFNFLTKPWSLIEEACLSLQNCDELHLETPQEVDVEGLFGVCES
jgi:hypothetical protein